MTAGIVKHTHSPGEHSSVWHEGSLAECPDSTWTEIMYEGKPARFYHGLSVTLPPNTSKRLRLIDKVSPIK